MDTHRSRMRIWMLLLVLLVGSGGLVSHFKVHEPLLLERAAKVADAMRWYKENPPQNDKTATGRHLFVVPQTTDQLLDTIVDHLEIRESEVGNETRLLHKFTIQLPFTAALMDKQFSPRGDRIVLVLVQRDYQPAIYLWLHRHFRTYVPAPTFRTSFWISRIDGSEMHEIGYLPLHFPEGSDTFEADLRSDEPAHIEWTQNGDKLSFTYHDALYTTPTD